MPRWPKSIRSSSKGDGTIKALDAKFDFDDNAVPDSGHRGFRDLDEEDPNEIAVFGSSALAYISLDGNTGVWSTVPPGDGDDGRHQVLRRAGLPLPRRPVARRKGPRRSGHAQERQRQGILVNIFGGIMRMRHDRQQG